MFKLVTLFPSANANIQNPLKISTEYALFLCHVLINLTFFPVYTFLISFVQMMMTATIPQRGAFFIQHFPSSHFVVLIFFICLLEKLQTVSNSYRQQQKEKAVRWIDKLSEIIGKRKFILRKIIWWQSILLDRDNEDIWNFRFYFVPTYQFLRNARKLKFNFEKFLWWCKKADIFNTNLGVGYQVFLTMYLKL